jgi:hypothetical protein
MLAVTTASTRRPGLEQDLHADERGGQGNCPALD